MLVSVSLNKAPNSIKQILVLPETTKVVGILLEPGLYSVENKNFLVQVYNIRANSISLKKGTCLGLAEVIEECSDIKLQIIDQCNLVNSDHDSNEDRDRKFKKN